MDEPWSIVSPTFETRQRKMFVFAAVVPGTSMHSTDISKSILNSSMRRAAFNESDIAPIFKSYVPLYAHTQTDRVVSHVYREGRSSEAF